MKLHRYLEDTIDFLWNNKGIYKNSLRYYLYCLKHKILNVGSIEDYDIQDSEVGDWDYTPDFDYPDYGGLPKNISKRLDGDFVDAIQNAWSPMRYKQKGQFKRAILDYDGMNIKSYIRKAK